MSEPDFSQSMPSHEPAFVNIAIDAVAVFPYRYTATFRSLCRLPALVQRLVY